jgi:hypothetical protein
MSPVCFAMPPDAPFTVSSAAAAHVRAVLRYVADAVPETADLVPALRRGGSRTTWVWEGGSARPEFSDEDYSVGYYRPEQVADWPRVRVAGTELAADRETLDRLRGLHLMLTAAIDGDPLSGQLVVRRY